MKRNLLTIILYFSLTHFYSQNSKDSLWNIWNTKTIADTTRLEALHRYSWDSYLYSQPDSAFYFAQLEYDFAKKKGLKKQMAAARNTQGVSFRIRGDYANAINFFLQNLKLFEELGDKEGIGKSLNNIGNIYREQRDNDKAIEYYFKSLDIQNQIGRKIGIAATMGNIANIFADKGDYTRAISYFNQSLIIYNELKHKQGIATSLSSIGNINKTNKDYKKALTFYNQSLNIQEEIGDEIGMTLSLINIGKVYYEQGNPLESIEYFQKALNIAQKIGNLLNIKESSLLLFKSYKSINKYSKALEMHELFVSSSDSLLNKKTQRETIQQELNYQYEKQAAIDSIRSIEAKKVYDAKIMAQQSEIKAKRNQQYGLYGGLLLVLMFTGFVYNRLKITQKQKIIIEQKEEETQQQKKLIEEKHKEITDSIDYAKRIQHSFLATTEMLDKNLKDYFVFFRPKDVVSGDFYWAGELNNGNFALTCADSTGHGVPGAIMSILNISSLEKSIEQETEPDKILNNTRKIIIERLKKDGSAEGGKDGMDCCLLVINKEKTQLSFAAANNPVYIVRDNQLIEFKPDKMPVGKHDKDFVSFSSQTIQLQKNDIIYTLTDGFPDQFGGDKGKKYMIKNLKEYILQIAQLPMQTQEQKLNDEFVFWKGENEQVDDVCILGVKI